MTGASSRSRTAAVVATGLATWLVLGLLVAGGDSATAPDALLESVARDLPEWLLTAFATPTDPPVVIALLALAAVAAARSGRWDVTACAILAPAVTLTINTWVSKPLFDRWYDDHLAYPSGHTVGLVTALTVLALLTPGRTRIVIAVLGAALTVLAAVGMAGLGYHYGTDVAGGAAFAVAATILTRLAAARAVSARSSTRRREPGP